MKNKNIIVILDTERQYEKEKKGKLTQISAIKVNLDTLEEISNIDIVVKFDEMDKITIDETGITLDQFQNGTPINNALSMISEFVGSYKIYAHGSKMKYTKEMLVDEFHIKKELKENKLPFLSKNKWINTQEIIKKYVPIVFKKSLKWLAESIGEEQIQHNGLSDCRLVLKVWKEYKNNSQKYITYSQEKHEDKLIANIITKLNEEKIRAIDLINKISALPTKE